MPADLTAQLLPGDALAGLPGAIDDLADILGQVAAALQLRDTRPAALAAAALQAATDAQAAQDAEAAAFEAGRQLEAQVAAAAAALRQLRALADELEAEGQARVADVEADRQTAAANGGRAERYVAQQAQLEAALAAAGYAPELSQVALQARGREHAGLAAELAGVRRELERYAGLPADAEEARALTAAKRAELERLRCKLREHLDSLA